MMNKILSLAAAFLFLFSSMAAAEVATGQPAKDFTLQDTNGQAHQLADYKGKYVVLEWINHDCPFVKKHYDSNNMQSLQKEFTDKGVVWLSINSSAPGKEGNYSAEETNAMTQEKNAAPTAVLLDADGSVGKMYGAQTTPHMYVINPEGVLIYQGAIDDKPSVDPNDIPNSTNYVRQALEASMAGQTVTASTTKSYGCSVKYGKS